VDKDHVRIIDEVQRQNSAGLRAAIHQHLRNSCDAVIASLARVDRQKNTTPSGGRKRARG
jgi:DNA-binding GntR family transcriptional regulator